MRNITLQYTRPSHNLLPQASSLQAPGRIHQVDLIKEEISSIFIYLSDFPHQLYYVDSGPMARLFLCEKYASNFCFVISNWSNPPSQFPPES